MGHGSTGIWKVEKGHLNIKLDCGDHCNESSMKNECSWTKVPANGERGVGDDDDGAPLFVRAEGKALNFSSRKWVVAS